VETKLRIVLGVLRGELSAAEAARRHGISETSIGKWKEQFLGAGKTGLAAAMGPRRGPSAREVQLAAQVDDLAGAGGGPCRAAVRPATGRGSFLLRAGGDAPPGGAERRAVVPAGGNPSLDVVSLGGARA
jgi:transposase-like protein